MSKNATCLLSQEEDQRSKDSSQILIPLRNMELVDQMTMESTDDSVIESPELVNKVKELKTTEVDSETETLSLEIPEDEENCENDDSIIIEEEGEKESAEEEAHSMEALSEKENEKNIESSASSGAEINDVSVIVEDQPKIVTIDVFDDETADRENKDDVLSADEDDDIIIEEVMSISGQEKIFEEPQAMEDIEVLDIFNENAEAEKVKKNLFQDEIDLPIPMETKSDKSTKDSEGSSVDDSDEISILDVTIESRKSALSAKNSEEDPDEIEILEVSSSEVNNSSRTTRAKAKLNANVSTPSAKCPNCRQRLNDAITFEPSAGVGEPEVAASPEINIVDMEDDDDSFALQYKITGTFGVDYTNLILLF